MNVEIKLGGFAALGATLGRGKPEFFRRLNR